MSPQLAEAPKLPKMELIPPRGAEVEGVFRRPGSPHDGRIIYTETVLDVEATKASATPKLDSQGNEIWKKHSTTGEPLYPILVKTTKYKDIRYILQPQEVGRNVKKVYHFEPTAAELKLIAQKEAERNFLEDFVSAAAASGMSAAELVAKLKADTLGEGEDPDAVELDVTEEIVAEAMANLGGDVIERPDDEETVAVTEKQKRSKKKK